MTLNDLERRNDRLVCVISSNSVDLGPYYLKVVEVFRGKYLGLRDDRYHNYYYIHSPGGVVNVISFRMAAILCLSVRLPKKVIEREL